MAAIVCLTVPISFCAGDDVRITRDVTVTIPPATVTQEVVAPKPAGVTPVTPEQPAENKGETTVNPLTVASETVDVSLTGPPSVGSGDFVIVAFADATEGAELTFTYDPDPGPTHRTVFQEFGGKRKLVVFVQPPAGAYRIALIGQITTAGKDPIDVAVHDVTVGTVPPTPPVPPGPGPNPPTPPTPDAAPFPADGLHVLVVYESSKMNSLTPDQRTIIQGVDVRSALDSAAPGKHRFYDPDADLTYAPPVWKAAMAVKRDSLPWLAISNGKTGYSGPLDMTPAQFRDLLAKFK